MSRRVRRWLVALAILVLLFALSLLWLSRPDRVAGMILDRAGTALGLEITAAGANEYTLFGTPTLVLRDVIAKQPGAGTPILRAERVYLRLPWSTIRARGVDPVTERIELDAPQLDVAALQRWLATRPPSETRIPTLSKGLQVQRGRVSGEGWSLQAIDLSMPSLHPDRRVRARVRGQAIASDTRLPFDLRLALTRPAIGAGLGVAGQIGVRTNEWTLATKPILAGRVFSDPAGVGLERMKLGASARYRSGATDLPFAFGIAGPLRYGKSTLQIAPLGSVVRGSGAIPTLDAHGHATFGETLLLQLAGTIAAWPEAWPALPPPVGASTSPLPFTLAYDGNPDFGDTASLQLQRDETRFIGRFRLPEIMHWLDAGANASPLPPLDGQLTTPRLEISGAQLEGVEIEIDDAGPTPATVQ